jgi:hypothetical protein
MEQNKDPEINPCMYSQFIFDKDKITCFGERKVSSLNGAEESGYLHTAECN